MSRAVIASWSLVHFHKIKVAQLKTWGSMEFGRDVGADGHHGM